MKWFVIKPKRAEISKFLLYGITYIDNAADLVDSVDKADSVVITRNFARSKAAVADYKYASEHKLKMHSEGTLTDWCVAKPT